MVGLGQSYSKTITIGQSMDSSCVSVQGLLGSPALATLSDDPPSNQTNATPDDSSTSISSVSSPQTTASSTDDPIPSNSSQSDRSTPVFAAIPFRQSSSPSSSDSSPTNTDPEADADSPPATSSFEDEFPLTTSSLEDPENDETPLNVSIGSSLETNDNGDAWLLEGEDAPSLASSPTPTSSASASSSSSSPSTPLGNGMGPDPDDQLDATAVMIGSPPSPAQAAPTDIFTSVDGKKGNGAVLAAASLDVHASNDDEDGPAGAGAQKKDGSLSDNDEGWEGDAPASSASPAPAPTAITTTGGSSSPVLGEKVDPALIATKTGAIDLDATTLALPT
jgi:hypothetical protein